VEKDVRDKKLAMSQQCGLTVKLANSNLSSIRKSITSRLRKLMLPLYSGRLWSLLLWRYSRPAWTMSYAACCRCPYFGRGVGLDDPKGPFQPQTFCDSALVSHPKCQDKSCAPQYKRDIGLLEQVQQKVMKVTKGLKHLLYEERLSEIGAFRKEGILSMLINT